MDSVTLITGGTGLIGGEVILSLAKNRVPVRAIVRASSDQSARARLFARLKKSTVYRPSLDSLIEAVAGDTTMEMFGTTRWANVGRIIHCAANTQFSDRESDSVWATNVGGAQRLVAAARHAVPSARVVFVSTASVVTSPVGTLLDERASFGGHANTYTRSKREAEAIVSASGLDFVILRPSIVLSRGVQDRAMARSILWAVPIMNELGAVPVDPDAHIDFVPVDYVADAIMRVGLTPTLNHRVFNISAGKRSHTFAELLEAVTNEHPSFGRIHPAGRHARISTRRRARLLGPIEAYLPFINADVRYAADRLAAEIGLSEDVPQALSYVPELVGLISLQEALEEMSAP